MTIGSLTESWAQAFPHVARYLWHLPGYLLPAVVNAVHDDDRRRDLPPNRPARRAAARKRNRKGKG